MSPGARGTGGWREPEAHNVPSHASSHTLHAANLPPRLQLCIKIRDLATGSVVFRARSVRSSHLGSSLRCSSVSRTAVSTRLLGQRTRIVQYCWSSSWDSLQELSRVILVAHQSGHGAGINHTRIDINLARMSQAVYFRLLPQTSCVANLGDECIRSSSSSLNKLAHRTCAFTKQPAKKAPQRGLRVRGLRNREFRSCARRSMVTNVAAPDQMRGTAPYERVSECLVYPSLDPSGRMKGIIHFLGGAFIGAAPDVIYSVLIELLAKEGFLIVATPYSLSFDHTVSAQGIHSRFNSCLDYMSTIGFGLLSAQEISSLPVYSVGHSLGALMQVLIGSTCSGRLPQASAIISFNNKPASDAVPFFEQMGPTLAQVAPLVESSPVTEFARAFSSEAIRAVLDSRIPLPPAVADNLQSVRQFLDQIPAVFDQVSQGVSEFTPTPAQNRATASVSYAVPNNLLVKFTQDAIDETDTLEDILRPRSEVLGGKLTKVVLNGTHLTPVAPDVKWQTGREYTPADAVAQVFRNAALVDLRGLSRNIADWFSSL